MEDLLEPKKNTSMKKIRTTLIFLVLGLVVIATLFIVRLYTPLVLSQELRITVPEGFSIIQTGNMLEEKGLIRSATLFRVLAQLDDISVKAGTYAFDGSVGITEVIERLRIADYGDVYTSITIPEGTTRVQMIDIFKEKIENFDSDMFLSLTEGKEGYLFPDTYQFLPAVNTETVVGVLLDTFEERTEDLQGKSDRSWQDIVIMASLIEKEATGNIEEKKIVAGILWKRLDEGKLLQIDAPFQYINGTVRAADLRIDGPYNTYTRKGLTPTAIGNPGIDALEAALDPISSPYYFYLHAPNGQIYYGKNYNEHVNNINRYLR